MSEKQFNEYRVKDEEDIKEDDVDMEEVDQKPPKERKWYKHVYKSSQRKVNFRPHQPVPKHRSKQQKGFHGERKPILDLRSRVIEHNRRDAQLQKEYVA